MLSLGYLNTWKSSNANVRNWLATDLIDCTIRSEPIFKIARSDMSYYKLSVQHLITQTISTIFFCFI